MRVQLECQDGTGTIQVPQVNSKTQPNEDQQILIGQLETRGIQVPKYHTWHDFGNLVASWHSAWTLYERPTRLIRPPGHRTESEIVVNIALYWIICDFGLKDHIHFGFWDLIPEKQVSEPSGRLSRSGLRGYASKASKIPPSIPPPFQKKA